MSIRKWSVVFFILLGMVFFGKQLILQGSFFCLRTYLFLSKGWHFSYDSLSWQKRQIVIENGTLDLGLDARVVAPKMIISLQEHQLFLEKPFIDVSSIGKGEGFSFPWKMVISDGELQCFGWTFSQVSLEVQEEKVVGSFGIKDNGSRVSFDVGLGIHPFWTFVLENVDLSFLGNPWSSCIQGKITGFQDEKGSFASQCHLDVSRLQVSDLLQDVSLSLDWDGRSLENIFAFLDFDVFLKTFLDGEMRAKLLQGKICFENSQICDLKGDFGIHGSLGARWNILGRVGSEPISLSGKGVYQSLEKSWLESLIRYGETSFFFQAREEKETYVSDLQVHLAIQENAPIFQDIAQLISRKWKRPLVLHQAVMDGAFRFIWERGSLITWDVLDFDLKNVHFSMDGDSLFCERALFKEGMYFLNGGRLLHQKTEILWQAEGNAAKKEGLFSLKGNEWQAICDFVGDSSSFHGSCSLLGEMDGEFLFSGKWEETLSFAVNQGKFHIFSLSLSDFSLEMEASLEKVSLYHVKGLLDIGSIFSIYCPIVETDGVFDLRLEQDHLSLLRLTGSSKKGCLNVDEERSFCLGSHVSKGSCLCTKEGLQKGSLQFCLPKAFLNERILPFFSKMKLSGPFIENDCTFQIEYDCFLGTEISLFTDSIKEYLKISYRDSLWRYKGEMGDFSLDGSVALSKKGIFLTEGSVHWKNHISCVTTARFASLQNWDVRLDAMEMNVHAFIPWISEGKLQGEGTIKCQGEIQADFDLIPSLMHFDGWCFENQDPLHVMIHSEQGLFVRGMNVAFIDLQNGLPLLYSKASLVYFDFQNSTLRLDDCLCQSNVGSLQEHSSFESASVPLKTFLFSLKKDLHFEADIETTLDFSSILCVMKEGLIPIYDDVYHVQNLSLNLYQMECRFSCDVANGSSWIPIECELSLGHVLKGSVIVQKELVIEGFFDDSLHIQSIEGRFLGMEISFHEQGDFLIGRADVNCHVLSQFLPSSVVKVFEELKMGDGYELMGKMQILREGFYFQGILSGKDLELFSFQFKTLLAQIDISPEHVVISDLKVSDLAGSLKIDRIVAKGTKEDPWTIEMPHLFISELRPSLLQEGDRKVEKPANPLVIRQLKIENFHGFLDDSKTYAAKGDLHFINSYKRGESILELPSNLLSRIVGLDFDLLVPVRGTLRYELKQGKFHLTELVDAYSENARSEFFLVNTEDCPTVDLDWNLNILIKMKQFVLFKFTEAFLISITGTLGKPEFHLQSKKRFLGFDL